MSESPDATPDADLAEMMDGVPIRTEVVELIREREDDRTAGSVRWGSTFTASLYRGLRNSLGTAYT